MAESAYRQVALAALEASKAEDFGIRAGVLTKCVRDLVALDPEKSLEKRGGFDKGRFDKFQEWLVGNGAECGDVKVAAVEELGCNGVICEAGMAKGEVAFSVPRKVMIANEDILDKKTGFLSLLANEDPLLRSTPTVALAVYLMLEKSKKASSFYAPYIDILPDDFPGLPMMWSQSDLDMLESTYAGDIALKRISNMIMYYVHLHPLVHKHMTFTFEQFRWALCIAMTRQNPLPTKTGANGLALIPLFDMCNHKAGIMSSNYDPGKRIVECMAMEDFKQGEQFSIFYGERSNSELLVYSGFVLEPGCNAYEKVKVPFKLDESDPLYKLRNLLLKKTNMESWLTLSPERDEASIQMARLHVYTKQELATLMHEQKEYGSSAILQVSPAVESKVDLFLKQRIQISIAEKQAKLEKLDTDTGYNGRLVIRLLRGEIAALNALC
uniref:protein-histidine N-methyltransferase n=1 Tax=Mucochytrium quahogii TaxID=96639 RepID=A0A7S2RJB8_9STRA|mmetsp:Transcript_15974/g.26111  ORF Transcript_15974/g.26111 Transcript_15974/m.26111 type:complete len:440 (+) Transcript_15974:34-1353(+)